MQLNDIDKIGLMREAYLIEGIGAAECRSIFLDWAIKLPVGVDNRDAIRLVLETYGPANPDHPMTAVLNEGLEEAQPKGRRGGRSGRTGQA